MILNDFQIVFIHKDTNFDLYFPIKRKYTKKIKDPDYYERKTKYDFLIKNNLLYKN